MKTERPVSIDMVYPYIQGDGKDFSDIKIFIKKEFTLTYGDVIGIREFTFYITSIEFINEPDWFEEYEVLIVKILSNQSVISDLTNDTWTKMPHIKLINSKHNG